MQLRATQLKVPLYVNCQGPFVDQHTNDDGERYEHFKATVHYNFKRPNVWDDNNGQAHIITAKGPTKKVSVENACEQILEAINYKPTRERITDAEAVMRNRGRRNRQKHQQCWPGKIKRMASYYAQRNANNYDDYLFQKYCHSKPAYTGWYGNNGNHRGGVNLNKFF